MRCDQNKNYFIYLISFPVMNEKLIASPKGEANSSNSGKNEKKRGPDFPFLPILPSGTINPTSLVPWHMAGAKIKSPVHGTPSHCNATQRGRLDPYLFIGIRSISDSQQI